MTQTPIDIASAKNPRVKAWRRLAEREGRRESGCFLIEGAHLVQAALQACPDEIEELILREGTAPPSGHRNRVTVVSAAVMSALSDTAQPQGVAAVCRLPDPLEPTLPGGRFLLVDEVRDPGNLGTIIRTADAAGLTAVVLGTGCADPFQPKVVRGSQGSIFHLPIMQGDLEGWIANLRNTGVAVLGSATQGKVFSSEAPGQPFALLVGNESHGVRPELLAMTDRSIAIPMHGRAESLSVAVATGILLFHLVG